MSHDGEEWNLTGNEYNAWRLDGGIFASQLDKGNGCRAEISV
jgi:hypothetical protein